MALRCEPLKLPLERWFERNARFVFPAPAILSLIVLMVVPLIYTVHLSLQEWTPSSVVGPKFIGLRNYLDLVNADERFWPALLRTLIFSAGSVAFSIVIGLGAAHLLVRTFVGRGVARTLFLLPMIATPVAMALVWTTMMNPAIGVLNYPLRSLGLQGIEWISNVRTVLLSLILVETWMWAPMVALIILAGLSSLPAEPFESAKVDGASGWQMFWFITLPMLRPTIVIATLFRAIDSLKVFDLIYVMTDGGPGFTSETLNIYVFQTTFKYLHFGYSSALLLVFFAIVMSVSVLLLRVRRAQ